ncbi:MAG: 50S ribosomal protein L9 [bacterium]
MNVYLLKDVENVGLAGSIVKVSDGFGQNFLVPRKLAIKVTSNNQTFYESKIVKAKIDKKVLNSKIAMVAEHIKNLNLTIKEKTHDSGKLYGSVGPDEIVELLKTKDIIVNRKQIEFTKTIKNIGEHKVCVRLSSKLKPEFTLKVVAK